MSDEVKNATPAYVSYGTFKNTVRGLAAHGDLPDRIDHTLLRGMSGSARTQFFAAMRFFGLINKDGVPSPELRTLATANEQEWKATVKLLIERAYARQVPLLASGSPGQLRESFGDIGGAILPPAVRFLIAAAKDADIPVSPHIMKNAAGQRVARKKKPAGEANGGAALFNGDGLQQQNHRVDAPKPAGPPSLIDALLAKFPAFDPTWGEAQQTAWFSAYERLLGMSGAPQADAKK